MKKIILTAVATAAVAAALPAAAQSYARPDYRGGPAYDQRYDQRYGQRYDQRSQRALQAETQRLIAKRSQIHGRIEQLRRAGRLTNNEAYQLRVEHTAIGRQHSNLAARGGFTWNDLRVIDQRLDRLTDRMRRMARPERASYQRRW
jgi:hypothetical protein